jgi:preprotein translocase subunit YajC
MKILRLFVFTIFYSAESKKHAKKRKHRQPEVRQNDQLVTLMHFLKLA